MATYKSFEELDCWKKCREVRIWIMEISKQFPSHEKFDLVDNVKRAARSSTRNIAEGFGRHTYKDNMHFCRISRGSLFEVLDDLSIAYEEKYISVEEYKTGRKKVIVAIKSLNGYLKYLNSLL